MKELVYLVKSDLYRYHRNCGFKQFIKEMLTNKGFIFSFWLRICKYYENNKIMLFVPKLFYRHYKKIFVTDIHYKATIGPGLAIYHLFSSTFGGDVKIGKNFVMSHGVTIGSTSRGKNKGVPTIGDNVYVAPGAMIVGGITIGNNVVIGGNAVVTKDVPDNSVVVGIPGKVVSDKGAEGYVRNTDYDEILKKYK